MEDKAQQDPDQASQQQPDLVSKGIVSHSFYLFLQAPVRPWQKLLSIICACLTTV